MNRKLVEEALYAYKYLPRKIASLAIDVEQLIPPAPGSVLKMTGRPVAKTPFDTSETERWALRRATCREAVELEAKEALRELLREWQFTLSATEQEVLRLRYGKELKDYQALKRSSIPERSYYRNKERLLRSAEDCLRSADINVDLAVK